MSDALYPRCPPDPGGRGAQLPVAGGGAAAGGRGGGGLLPQHPGVSTQVGVSLLPAPTPDLRGRDRGG